MDSKRYFAHLSEDLREQTILEHLTNTAELAEGFAAPFGAGEQARLAGMAHDLGKYSDAFQRRIRGSTEHADHSTAGASECFKMRHVPAAFAVAGHHGGLPDFGSRSDAETAPTLQGRLRRAEMGLIPPCEEWRKEIQLPNFNEQNSKYANAGQIMFFIRMLYSCLVDADFLDTEAFMNGRAREALSTDTMEVLAERLDAHCSRWFPPKTKLNENRCAILNRCRQQGRIHPQGLFTLTVPTGGGKTIASMAFALQHARKNHLRRIIYVIPYTSIIEQNAAVFRDLLGAENVLEHHSGVLFDVGTEATPHSIGMAKATENWDAPVVVTTAVQFFESLYANRSSKCRKLHNIAQSVIIFDEAQMMPIPYLKACTFAIAELVRAYGVSAVLCTATQPALNGLFREFLPQTTPVELCPEAVYDREVFRRVTFVREGLLKDDELAQRLSTFDQILCIVNTRKAAQSLYEKLPAEGSYHLSTLMTPCHRKKMLKEIRARLDDGQICRVVSTSLIEAGVDVDFPAVYREESGLDSILQAAGRCNREGKNSAEDSEVTVFRGENPAPPLMKIPIAAGRTALRSGAAADSRKTIELYFRELLGLKGNAALDQRGIMSMMMEGTFAFSTLAEKFHLIDSPTRTVYIPLGEGVDLVQRLREGERSRNLFRALDQHSVNIYQQHFEALYRAGAIELVDENAAVLNDLSLYSDQTGLSLEADGGRCDFI